MGKIICKNNQRKTNLALIQGELKKRERKAKFQPHCKTKWENNRNHLFLSLHMEIGKILIILVILLPAITTLKKPGDKNDFTTKPMPKERDIDESMDMSRKYKVKPGHTVEPVIFEPQRKIRLSRSMYKVNSYIDFKPYKETFKQFGHYMARSLKDIHDSHYVGNLYNINRPKGVSIVHIGENEKNHFGTFACKQATYNVGFRISIYN